MAKVTLKQIAERAGVSINTVSLALRDMPNVNPDTRARICGIAAELGYYAHKSHRTPSKKLGLISTGAHLKDSYFYVAFQKLGSRSAGAASLADGKRDQRCFDPRGHGRNAGG